jgi:hypothetical protein
MRMTGRNALGVPHARRASFGVVSDRCAGAAARSVRFFDEAAPGLIPDARPKDGRYIFAVTGITLAPISSMERIVVAWSIRDSWASSSR